MAKLKILHISDLHFGPAFRPFVGEALLQLADGMKPDMVAISGDFTQRARPEQFKEAYEFLQRLRESSSTIVSTPGNHDVPLYKLWDRIFSPYESYRTYIDQELDKCVLLDGLAMASLNSTDPLTSIKEGRLTTRQMRICQDFFAPLPEHVYRIVMLHHHVFPIPDFGRPSIIPKAKRILDLLTRMRVDMILCGHIHRSFIGDSLDVYSGEERDKGILVVSCGTSTSRRGRWPEQEKNTLNFLELDTNEVAITHYMYFSGDHAFLPTSRHQFARTSREKKSIRGSSSLPCRDGPQ